MPAELYTDRARVPDGREEVEGKEIMILFRDAKQVKQGWSKLVDGGRVEEEGEDVAKEGPKGSLDPWQVDSAGYVMPFLHCLVVVPAIGLTSSRGCVLAFNRTFAFLHVVEDVNCLLTSHISWFCRQVVDNRVVRDIGDASLRAEY